MGGAEYSVQASTLFDFLRKTFPQMPRAVQVVGWLVILFLFVLLVLYPLVGVTYLQGKIVPLSDDKNSKALVRGIRVSKGSTTYTNEDGEFTLAIRVPNLPLLTIDLDIGDELVSVPGPFPFVSLFNPNARKIYFVPGSTIRNDLNVIQHYFLDRISASRAYEAVRAVTQMSDAGPRAPRESLMSSWSIRSADAAEKTYQAPTYTLRVDEFAVTEGDKVSEVYFDIRVDGRGARPEGVPNASSRAIDRLTVIKGVPVKPAEVDIPLKQPSARVELGVYTAGFFRDSRIGSVAIDVGRVQVGQRVRVEGAGMTAELELLPPVAIGTIGVAVERGAVFSAAWLDVQDEFAGTILGVRWASGNAEVPGARDRYFYGGSRSSGSVARARVQFVTGSDLRLATGSQTVLREPRTPPELFAALDIVRREGDVARALALVERAARVAGTAPWLAQIKGAILRETGRFDEALAAYVQVLKDDPESPSNLVGYALTVVDRPGSGRGELERAQQLVEKAIKADPSFIFSYVALGGIAVRLGDYSRAVDILTREEQTEVLQGIKKSVPLQRNHYYLGQAYLGLGKKQEARAALRDVVEYVDRLNFHSIGNKQLAELARAELAKLQ
ncbi:MAG TPA: tetratricopeptide repeat protein [Polyangiaceae bacterium]|nr:tetratricopeptide repeat protein [Polyangiaceae bacterium]